VANVAPKPLKQPLTPSLRYISCKDFKILGGWETLFSIAPATCNLVLTKSSGAQTTEASDPEPTPAMIDEEK